MLIAKMSVRNFSDFGPKGIEAYQFLRRPVRDDPVSALRGTGL